MENMRDKKYILLMSDEEWSTDFQPNYLDTKIISKCKVIKIHDEIKDGIFRKAEIIRKNEGILLHPDLTHKQAYINNGRQWNDKKERKRFINDMMDRMEDMLAIGMHARMILDMAIEPYTLVYVYSKEISDFEPVEYLDTFREIYRDKLALKVRLFKEFSKNPEKYEIIIDEGIRNNVASILYDKQPQQYMYLLSQIGLIGNYPDLILPKDLENLKVSQLKKVLRSYNLPPKQYIPSSAKDGGSLEIELVHNICEVISPILNKQIITIIKGINIEEVSVFELWRYATCLDIMSDDLRILEKKEIVDYILSMEDDILNSMEKEILNRSKLMAMSDLDLIKLGKQLGVKGLSPYIKNGRQLMIKEILNIKGIVEDDEYVLPDKKELMKMSHMDLFKIYMEKLNGNDKTELSYKKIKNFPKDIFVKFLIDKYSQILSDRILFNTTGNDIEKMTKDELIDFVKGTVLNKESRKNMVREIKDMKRKEAIIFVLRMFDMEVTQDVHSSDIPEKKRLKEMDKKELYKLGLDIGVQVSKLDSRRELIDLINEYREELYDKEKLQNKETKLSVKNLKKASKLELKQFCQCYGIKYELDWNKEKYAKRIIKFIERECNKKENEVEETEFKELNRSTDGRALIDIFNMYSNF